MILWTIYCLSAGIFAPCVRIEFTSAAYCEKWLVEAVDNNVVTFGAGVKPLCVPKVPAEG